jgi:hypothetical protein
MSTLFDAADRAAIHERLDRLRPELRAQWGRMNAPQMVCHVADQLRVALGDLATEAKPIFLRNRLLRQIFVYWLPWPKGKVPTAREMLSSQPETWEADVAAVHRLVDRFATRTPGGEWAVHPAFGPLSGREWGVLSQKHLDHHLRQFGV